MIMGRYINKLPNGTPLPKKGKADALLSIEGAVDITKSVNTPTRGINMTDVSGLNVRPGAKDNSELICVFENKDFDAALYIETQRQFDTAKAEEPSRAGANRYITIPNLGSLILKLTGDE